MTTNFQYQCDKKRGLSKEGLIEDLRASIEVMKTKGYFDENFNMEIPLYPGHILKITLIKEEK